MAKRNSNAKTSVITKTVRSGLAVRIEYPREGEVLTHPSYTFQIATAPGAKGVEISIDQEDWKPCRESLGLWWYDWSDYSKGVHVLVARRIMADGITTTSAHCLFSVAS